MIFWDLTRSPKISHDLLIWHLTWLTGLNQFRSQLVAQFMPFSSAHCNWLSLAHCPALSGSLWPSLVLSGSLYGSLWLSLTLYGSLSGSLWLSLALYCPRICLRSPCSARSVATAIQHFIQPWLTGSDFTDGFWSYLSNLKLSGQSVAIMVLRDVSTSKNKSYTICIQF